MLTALPLDIVWPKVKDRVASILEQQETDITENELFILLKEKQAFLYTTDEDGSFTVVRPKVNYRTGETALFIVLAYGEGYAQGKHLDKFFELARGMGASRIEMESRRKGFIRTGWKLDRFVYSMEVPYGGRR